MRKSASGTVFSKRNRFTRTCIAESLIKLLSKHTLEEITITDLVKVAGVSRMTFYKYYESKSDVLVDYLYEIVDEYKAQTTVRDDIGSFNDYVHIHHSFEFFKSYSDFILILIHSNQYSILINALNEYMDTCVLPFTKRSKFQLYFYAGALCNTYVQWIESGMKESAEEIARLVYGNL